MAIRQIARDLYRLTRECEALERKLQDAPIEKRAAIESELRKRRTERERVRRALDGATERQQRRI